MPFSRIFLYILIQCNTIRHDVDNFPTYYNYVFASIANLTCILVMNGNVVFDKHNNSAMSNYLSQSEIE